MGCILAVSILCAAPTRAQDSPLDSLGKAAGLISPPADPPDFVKASRPSETPAAIPAFAPPEEPRSKVKSAAELKTMDADLERAAGGAPPRKARSQTRLTGRRK